jgi:hypothetical protein
MNTTNLENYTCRTFIKNIIHFNSKDIYSDLSAKRNRHANLQIAGRPDLTGGSSDPSARFSTRKSISDCMYHNSVQMSPPFALLLRALEMRILANVTKVARRFLVSRNWNRTLQQTSASNLALRNRRSLKVKIPKTRNLP